MSGRKKLGYSQQALVKNSALQGGRLESPRSSRIEESLMQRYRQSQSRLAVLKAQVQAQEMRELRPAPSINATSRRIAHSVSTVISPKAKSSTTRVGLRANSQETEQSIARTEPAPSTRPPPPPIELRCHVSLTSGTISPVCPALRQGDEAAQTSIEALRTQVKARYSEAGQLEPPPDMLEMAVLERQAYFVERKEARLREKRERKEEEEVRGCTFRPSLTPRRSRSVQHSARPSRSVSADRQKRSYYERYMHTKAMKDQGLSQMLPKTEVSVGREERRELRKVAYQPLSPVGVKVGFRSGLNLTEFLVNAKPMVNYRNVDIHKAIIMPKPSTKPS